MPFGPPDYTGNGLVNLVAELEIRLLGSAPMPGLSAPELIPDRPGYVLVIFDGLGSHQLDIAEARPLDAAAAARLSAGFPTTTTTSLATIATGLTPGGHGIVGHMMHLPGVAEVVNILKWITPGGKPVAHDYGSMLPAPNLWERLAGGRVEALTLQPEPFADSPLTRMLYRGCRFEPYRTVDELITATVDLARPGRLVVSYHPSVDVAAHVGGQSSGAYRRAVGEAARIWEAVANRLDEAIGLVGTADHGHVDYRDEDKILIRDRRFDRLRLFGDARALYATGPLDLIADLADSTRATVVERPQLEAWLACENPHPDLEGRLPDRVLMAPDAKLLLPRPFDRRLVGYHGGLTPAEVEIPLLVG